MMFELAYSLTQKDMIPFRIAFAPHGGILTELC